MAAAMHFSDGVFSELTATVLNVNTMNVTETKTTSASVGDQFLEMLAGNSSAYGTNFVGTVYTKYDATNDFFLGIFNKTLMLGDATATRSNGKITDISGISLQPVMTRADSSGLDNNHLLKWDSANYRAVDAGFGADAVSDLQSRTTALESAVYAPFELVGIGDGRYKITSSNRLVQVERGRYKIIGA